MRAGFKPGLQETARSQCRISHLCDALQPGQGPGCYKREDPLDLREHPRHEVQIPVSFLGDDVAGKGTVSNLSLGGCAVKGDKFLRVGAFLELSVNLPGPERNLSVDVAVVRWTLGEKFGLDFLQMQPEEQKRLRRFIKSL